MGLQEEVEGIDDRHLGHQVDLDAELPGRLRKDQTGEIVALGILLPIDEMLLRADLERIGEDAGPGMGAGPQADDVRSETDQSVVVIVGDVVEGDVDGHAFLQKSSGSNNLRCKRVLALQGDWVA